MISTVAGPTMLNRTHLPTVLYSTIPTGAIVVLLVCLVGGYGTCLCVCVFVCVWK